MVKNSRIDISTLVREAQNGDKKALEGVIKRFTPLVIKLSMRIYIKGYELEDLIQAGQVSIIRAVNSYDLDRQRGLTTYISNTIKFNYYRLIRYKVKLLRECSINNINSIGSKGYGSIETLISNHNVEDEILQKEERIALYKAIKKLPEKERELIIWFYFKNRTLEEYAKEKGIIYRAAVERKRVAVKKLRYLMSVKFAKL